MQAPQFSRHGMHGIRHRPDRIVAIAAVGLAEAGQVESVDRPRLRKAIIKRFDLVGRGGGVDAVNSAEGASLPSTLVPRR